MSLSKRYTQSVSKRYEHKQATLTLEEVLHRSIDEFAEQAKIAARNLKPKEKDFLPDQVAAELQKIELTKLTPEDLYLVGYFYYLNTIRIIKVLENLETHIKRDGMPVMSDTNNFSYYYVNNENAEGHKVDCANSLVRAQEALILGGRNKEKDNNDYNNTTLVELHEKYDALTGFIDRYCVASPTESKSPEKKKSSYGVMAKILKEEDTKKHQDTPLALVGSKRKFSSVDTNNSQSSKKFRSKQELSLSSYLEIDLTLPSATNVAPLFVQSPEPFVQPAVTFQSHLTHIRDHYMLHAVFGSQPLAGEHKIENGGQSLPVFEASPRKP